MRAAKSEKNRGKVAGKEPVRCVSTELSLRIAELVNRACLRLRATLNLQCLAQRKTP